MTRTLMCRKYKEELPALERAPFPGAKGQDIFDHVSAKAWADWQKHQTLLINEKRLNMMNAEDRKCPDLWRPGMGRVRGRAVLLCICGT